MSTSTPTTIRSSSPAPVIVVLFACVVGACSAGPGSSGAPSPLEMTTTPGPSVDLAPSSPPPSPVSSASIERNPAAFMDDEPYRPAIDPAAFVATIDNPYMPLIPGTKTIYEGDGERIEVTVTDETRVVMGVTTTVVRDQAFEDDELIEDTFDWFAQDRAGNVWYFGEDTRELEGGEVVSTSGSWEAGVDGAQPGIVMLAEPRVGDVYRQEYAAGEAEDMARVLEVGTTLDGPYGAFDRVLVTEDFTPLEPDHVEHKSYAPTIGVVEERLVKGGEELVQLVEVTTTGG